MPARATALAVLFIVHAYYVRLLFNLLSFDFFLTQNLSFASVISSTIIFRFYISFSNFTAFMSAIDAPLSSWQYKNPLSSYLYLKLFYTIF